MPLEIGSVYTFNTKAPAILGAVVKNAKLLMSCNFETAMRFEDVETKYAQVLPALPSGSPFSPREQLFHYFQTESGEKVMIADLWIDSASLVAVTNLTLRYVVVNATSADRDNIAAAFARFGLTYTLES